MRRHWLLQRLVAALLTVLLLAGTNPSSRQPTALPSPPSLTAGDAPDAHAERSAPARVYVDGSAPARAVASGPFQTRTCAAAPSQVEEVLLKPGTASPLSFVHVAAHPSVWGEAQDLVMLDPSRGLCDRVETALRTRLLAGPSSARAPPAT